MNEVAQKQTPAYKRAYKDTKGWQLPNFWCIFLRNRSLKNWRNCSKGSDEERRRSEIRLCSQAIQKVDTTIYWINLWPVGSAIGFLSTYPLIMINPVDRAIYCFNYRSLLVRQNFIPDLCVCLVTNGFKIKVGCNERLERNSTSSVVYSTTNVRTERIHFFKVPLDCEHWYASIGSKFYYFSRQKYCSLKLVHFPACQSH